MTTEQTNDNQTGAGQLTPQARQEIAQYRVEHLSRELAGAPMAIRMYLDPILFDRVNRIAEMMAESNSMPEHLRGDLAACLNVVDRAWNWGLSPWAVAQGQFTVRRGATPGYYGRLIIAAINNSGRVEGGLQFEHFADQGASWDNVLGKFETRNSSKRQDADGNPVKYQVATYTDKDEVGLGVIVRGKLKGEDNPREMRVYLRQCQPRNSVIWATDPMTQIIYTAARRFGNAYCPDILLGVRTEDDFGPEERQEMRDITPKAPPPIDLESEGIAGQGHMTEADEAQQRDASKAKESKPPQQTEDKPANADDRPSWTIDGKSYVQSGRVEKILLEKIEACGLEQIAFYEDDNDGAEFIRSLPDQNRAAVEQAVAHRRSVIESDQERARQPGGDDDGDAGEPAGEQQEQSAAGQTTAEPARPQEQASGGKGGQFNLLSQ